jgi:hypothetical protein
MELYDFICNAKPEAEVILVFVSGINPIKPVENPFFIFIRYADSIVSYGDFSSSLRLQCRQTDLAVLICDGRDIEYRELKLTFDKSTHVWELLSDSIEHPETKLDQIIFLLSDFMKSQKSFFGTPAELAKVPQPGRTNSQYPKCPVP